MEQTLIEKALELRRAYRAAYAGAKRKGGSRPVSSGGYRNLRTRGGTGVNNIKIAKSRKADLILQALLSARTVREAALTIKVSEKTIYNYLHDPEFERLYNAQRADIIRGVANPTYATA
ncbi:MAG: hypothetical protein FWE97_00375 [Dehalococcoidia bacterium]|nr:hypothetical protein [Dehalococcoidia bacterium]